MNPTYSYQKESSLCECFNEKEPLIYLRIIIWLRYCPLHIWLIKSFLFKKKHLTCVLAITFLAHVHSNYFHNKYKDGNHISGRIRPYLFIQTRVTISKFKLISSLLWGNSQITVCTNPTYHDTGLQYHNIRHIQKGCRKGNNLRNLFIKYKIYNC